MAETSSMKLGATIGMKLKKERKKKTTVVVWENLKRRSWEEWVYRREIGGAKSKTKWSGGSGPLQKQRNIYNKYKIYNLFINHFDLHKTISK